MKNDLDYDRKLLYVIKKFYCFRYAKESEQIFTFNRSLINTLKDKNFLIYLFTKNSNSDQIPKIINIEKNLNINMELNFWLNY